MKKKNNKTEIESFLQKNIGQIFRIQLVKKDLYQIFTPFILADGDLISIYLKPEVTQDEKWWFENKLHNHIQWILTDLGNTNMRVSYQTHSINKKSVGNICKSFGIKTKNGALLAIVDDKAGGQFGIALFNLVQAIFHIEALAAL